MSAARRAASPIVVAACVLALSACGRRPPSAAEAPPPVGALEADALKVVTRYDEAWMKKDLGAVNKILAPEYVYFSSRGELSDLAKTRALLASPAYRLETGRREEMRAYRFGSTVVVDSHWIGAGAFDGKPFSDDQRCSIVVGFADGRGRVLAEHCTNITPK